MTLSRKLLKAFVLASGTTLVGCGTMDIPDLRDYAGYNPTASTPADVPQFEPVPEPAFEPQPLVDPKYIEIRRMQYFGTEAPRTIIVNPIARKLYLIEDGGYATEYPIGIGAQGVDADYSNLYVARKATNPTWTPTPSMRERNPNLPDQVAGGASNNPLGSHAIYFYDLRTRSDTLLRAHGTMDSARPTVGGNESSGCYRMLNEHAAHLHGRVHIYGDPTDPTHKARVRLSNSSIFTPGMNYQSAIWVNPYNITSGPKLAGVVP